METIANLLHYGISFIVIISIVVFIHEWGHYIVARMCGVRVEEFSIGFGKELKGWNDKHGTRWKICALPLGGFVKMYGDASGASNADQEKLNKMTEKQKQESFHYKSLWKKTLIVFAGPAINFIFAILIYMAIFMTFGNPTQGHPKVSNVMPDMPGQIAGFKAEDEIIAVDGRQIKSVETFLKIVGLSADQELKVTIKRGGQEMVLPVTPRSTEDKDFVGNTQKLGRIGIEIGNVNMGKEVKPLGLIAAVQDAARKVVEDCEVMLKGLGQIISGSRSAKELGGPIKILEYSGGATNKISSSFSCMINSQQDCSLMLKQGLLFSAMFMAMLSTMLGLMNLFPIPMLDGGHIMFYAIEAITRRSMAEKVQEWAFKVGFIFLISLMLYVTYNDIVSFIGRHLNS